jgi:hypothetical protein
MIETIQCSVETCKDIMMDNYPMAIVDRDSGDLRYFEGCLIAVYRMDIQELMMLVPEDL